MRIIGIILIILAVPGFYLWLQGRPARLRYAAFAAAFIPYHIGLLNLDAALLDWSMWPGHTKGLVLTLLDSLALAVLLVSRNRITIPVFTGLFLFYFFCTLLSVAVSETPMASAFYPIQVLRALIVFLAVTVLLSHDRCWDWLIYGFASVAIVQVTFSLAAKAQGTLQATGTMGHQNLLGLMLHFVTLPLLARILAGERNKFVWLGLFCGLLAAALTASRATIGFLSIGIAMILILSLIRKIDQVKLRALGIGLVAAIAIAPIAISSLSERFGDLPRGTSNYDERAAFELAATMILEDYPMGVGANRYVIVANTQGYLQAAGVASAGGSRATHVHNIYLLHAAEMGWLGLISFTALLLGAVIRGIRHAFQSRNHGKAELALGASVAILTMALHGLFEWIIVYAGPLYLLAIALAIIAASMRDAKQTRTSDNPRPHSSQKFDPIVRDVVR